MQAPCKDCEKRHPNCHSEREAYQAFWRANREENEKRLIENTAASIRIRQKEKKRMYWERLKQRRHRGGENYG